MPSGHHIDVEHRSVVLCTRGPVLAEEVVEGRGGLADDEDSRSSPGEDG